MTFTYKYLHKLGLLNQIMVFSLIFVHFFNDKVRMKLLFTVSVTWYEWPNCSCVTSKGVVQGQLIEF